MSNLPDDACGYVTMCRDGRDKGCLVYYGRAGTPIIVFTKGTHLEKVRENLWNRGLGMMAEVPRLGHPVRWVPWY